eukprot:scaffold151467_cov20-Tisochrysis_lutea.AAC.2
MSEGALWVFEEMLLISCWQVKCDCCIDNDVPTAPMAQFHLFQAIITKSRINQQSPACAFCASAFLADSSGWWGRVLELFKSNVDHKCVPARA